MIAPSREIQFTELQIRRGMTRGEVPHGIVTFKKCHRMTRETYAMPDAILRERQSGCLTAPASR